MTRTLIDELKHFLLLYASQTGQAKAIAEEIADTAPLHGFKAELHCLSLTDKRFSIEKSTCAVFIVSTTGDGEPPDSAIKFFRRISRHTLPKDFLQNLNYTLLGLGDSNYIKFCLFGRQLDQRLKALSANCFYPVGFGDDAFGIETGVDPWIQNLWAALQNQLSVPNAEILCHDNRSTVLSETRMTSTEAMSKIDLMNDEDISSLNFENLLSLLKDFNVDKCRFPKLPVPNFLVQYSGVTQKAKAVRILKEDFLPSRSSSLSKVSLLVAIRLTQGDDVKPTLELTFKFQSENIPYQVGDSFGFVCPNSLEEVKLLLNRCCLTDCEEKLVRFVVQENVKNHKVPSHLESNLTLIDIFTNFVEIRSVPKKILLRVLAEHTDDETEKNVLLFLSSPEGSKFYTQCIRKPSICVLDILMQFKSCKPPVEALFAYLPYLKPRFYSVSSSPLETTAMFRIVFNVVKFPKGDGRFDDREGVCTGWLRRISAGDVHINGEGEPTLESQLSDLDLNKSKDTIFVYKRTNKHFYLPESLSTPVIMVGPGTGIAPFVGFLQHREQLMIKYKNINSNIGQTWLFYGCRFAEKDFLYRTELHRLKSSGVLTHLCVSHSREPTLPPDVTSRYVHEDIKNHGGALTAVVKAGARIYVCGDAKHMAHDVQRAFIECFQEHCGLSAEEAKSFVENLQAEHKYINDVWT